MLSWRLILNRKRTRSDRLSARRPYVRRTAPGGFSLVEMLVCVSIVSIIAVGLMSVFFAGIRIWKRASGSGFSVMEAALEAERISGELRQCLSLSFTGCSGKAGELSFPLVSAGGRVIRVTYSFDPEEQRLTRSETDAASILAEDEETTERDIRCFSGFSAEFRRFDKDSRTFVWQDNWDKSLGVFGAVKLNFKAGDEEFSRLVLVPGR